MRKFIFVLVANQLLLAKRNIVRFELAKVRIPKIHIALLCTGVRTISRTIWSMQLINNASMFHLRCCDVFVVCAYTWNCVCVSIYIFDFMPHLINFFSVLIFPPTPSTTNSYLWKQFISFDGIPSQFIHCHVAGLCIFGFFIDYIIALAIVFFFCKLNNDRSNDEQSHFRCATCHFELYGMVHWFSRTLNQNLYIIFREKIHWIALWLWSGI